jgi:hypothetical protein
LKQHKPLFVEERLGFLDQRIQTKRQRFENPKESFADNLKGIKREASRHFRKNEKDYLIAKN